MTQNRDVAHWEEFQNHLEKISEVESYTLHKKSGTAKVYLEDGADGIGRKLFTRVAHMGFIVGEIHGVYNEIKFINILGEHHHYLPEEVEVSSS